MADDGEKSVLGDDSTGELGLPASCPPPSSNAEIREWYVQRTRYIGKHDDALKRDDVSLEDRARTAYETRHDARMKARSWMSWYQVQFLQVRDLWTYGNKDGPSFEDKVKEIREKNPDDTMEEVYEEIIASAQRTSETFTNLSGAKLKSKL